MNDAALSGGTEKVHDPVTIGDLAITNAITTREDLAKMKHSDLVAFWNGLPGVTAVKKFKDAATGMARIWKHLNPALAVAKPETKAKAPKKVKAVKAKATKKAKAPKAEKAPRKDTLKAIFLQKAARKSGITLQEFSDLTKEHSKNKKTWKTPSLHGMVANLNKAGYKVKSFAPDNGVRTYLIES